MAVVGDVSASPAGGAQLLNYDDCSHYAKLGAVRLSQSHVSEQTCALTAAICLLLY